MLHLSDVFIPAKAKTKTPNQNAGASQPLHNKTVLTTPEPACACISTYYYEFLYGDRMTEFNLSSFYTYCQWIQCVTELQLWFQKKVILKRSRWCGYETLQIVLVINYPITWLINIIHTPLWTHIQKTISASLVHMTGLPICFSFQYIIVL